MLLPEDHGPHWSVYVLDFTVGTAMLVGLYVLLFAH